ncbi:hypothetical protein [Cellulosimicrobium sp. Marseille-Q8652]
MPDAVRAGSVCGVTSGEAHRLGAEHDLTVDIGRRTTVRSCSTAHHVVLGAPGVATPGDGRRPGVVEWRAWTR